MYLTDREAYASPLRKGSVPYDIMERIVKIPHEGSDKEC